MDFTINFVPTIDAIEVWCSYWRQKTLSPVPSVSEFILLLGPHQLAPTFLGIIQSKPHYPDFRSNVLLLESNAGRSTRDAYKMSISIPCRKLRLRRRDDIHRFLFRLGIPIFPLPILIINCLPIVPILAHQVKISLIYIIYISSYTGQSINFITLNIH